MTGILQQVNAQQTCFASQCINHHFAGCNAIDKVVKRLTLQGLGIKMNIRGTVKSGRSQLNSGLPSGVYQLVKRDSGVATPEGIFFDRALCAWQRPRDRGKIEQPIPHYRHGI